MPDESNDYGIMEWILDYVCMVLLFMVFRTTMMVDCELFSELNMSEVRQGLAKTFLRMRRMRVNIGQAVLLVCSVRIGSVMIIIPLVNVVCMML